MNAHHCPKCGRFLRLQGGIDYSTFYLVVAGICAKHGVAFVTDEFYDDEEDDASP